VRGADLLDSTPRQIFLQRRLGLPTPAYAHLPVAVNAAGEKLSKQTLAPATDSRDPVPALLDAMRFLGQEPPTDIGSRTPCGAFHTTTADFWAWAKSAWRIDRVPRLRSSAAVFAAAESGDADRQSHGGVGEPAGGAGHE
jgi:glutamyl-Q tRNA(Asp) synthetase